MPNVAETPDIERPRKRGGHISPTAADEEVPVLLEISERPAATCTPDLPEAWAVGRLTDEGCVDSVDQVHLSPWATDLRLRDSLNPHRTEAVAAAARRPVLASGCGAVSTFLAAPATLEAPPPQLHGAR